jgi:hypothetical protein
MKTLNKNIKSTTCYKIAIVLLIIGLIVLGIEITNKENELNMVRNNSAHIEKLINTPDGALGYSCGVLDKDKAKELLESESLLLNFGQAPTNKITKEGITSENIFWSDNCSYKDKNDSSKYAELFINTFLTGEEANKNFLKFLPLAGEPKEIETQDFGDKLIYDSGVYFLLRGNKVYQVTASNGNPNEIKLLSENVLKYLYTNIR